MDSVQVLQFPPTDQRQEFSRSALVTKLTLGVQRTVQLSQYGIPVVSCPPVQGVARLSPEAAGIACVAVKCLDE